MHLTQCKYRYGATQHYRIPEESREEHISHVKLLLMSGPSFTYPDKLTFCRPINLLSTGLMNVGSEFCLFLKLHYVSYGDPKTSESLICAKLCNTLGFSTQKRSPPKTLGTIIALFPAYEPRLMWNEFLCFGILAYQNLHFSFSQLEKSHKKWIQNPNSFIQ